MSKLKGITSTRELLNWCVENQAKMLQNIDLIFDKCDIKDDDAKELLADATEILKEIEELEKEITELL
jgi:ferritin